MRMPGRSSGVPMNSMPPASSASVMAFRLARMLGGTPSCVSMRFIVLELTPDACASFSMLHPAAARAERI